MIDILNVNLEVSLGDLFTSNTRNADHPPGSSKPPQGPWGESKELSDRMEYITSLSNGAQDIVRGLAGQETGAAVTLAFEIHEEGPIGCAVNDAGQVTSVDAGSPAEKHGVRMGDLITHLNDAAVDPARAGAGLTGTAARPLRATAFRREPRDYDDFGVGVVKFRVDENGLNVTSPVTPGVTAAMRKKATAEQAKVGLARAGRKPLGPSSVARDAVVSVSIEYPR